MKQIIQSLSSGVTEVLDIPSPQVSAGKLLIKTSNSLVSAGTERMLVEFGKANLLGKARQQPDKVADVVSKIKADGLSTTIDAVRSKLDQPISLGYSNVGLVISVGSGVTGFKVGDRVVSNGAHSEFVLVPQNLCAHIPDCVSDESACFTILGAIGLQGIRLANPSLGEVFLVSGLGLIGLLTAQLLKAHGCIVLGIDPDPAKCSLAESFGITTLNLADGVNPISWVDNLTNSIGVDGVIITASTKSSDPVHVAAQVCRQRGRIVLVGVTGLDLRRDLFYEKEISFQVSCSYGPGRYDPSYELDGNDYPIGLVRWTEQRNFQAVLKALELGSLSTSTLVSHRFSLEDAPQAYDLLSCSSSSLGILLDYSSASGNKDTFVNLTPRPQIYAPTKPVLSVIGSGNYSSRILIPAFYKAGASFHTLSATSGVGPVHLGRKFNFIKATTDVSSVFSEPLVNAVVVATRHDSHARLVQESLVAGKHIFVEKPLCLSLSELDNIEESYTGDSILMVGFNRRFSSFTQALVGQLLSLQGPKSFVYTCNAGFIPPDHWTQKPNSGGGRLLGEACHFVDLLRYLADSPIDDIQFVSAADSKLCPDTFTLSLRFLDGSIGTIHYFANGHKSYPKERLEVFADSQVFRLDNFLKLEAWGVPQFRTLRRLKQDKGQAACCSAFLNAIDEGLPPPIPVDEIFEVQRWLLKAVHS